MHYFPFPSQSERIEVFLFVFLFSSTSSQYIYRYVNTIHLQKVKYHSHIFHINQEELRSLYTVGMRLVYVWGNGRHVGEIQIGRQRPFDGAQAV